MPVFAAPERLAEMLMNLFTNACEAMADGGTLRVVTETGVDPANHSPVPGTCAIIQIIDDGIGMDPGTLNRAFDPFFSTKASGIGRGLDLTTVYDIVTELKADISLASTPGRGTTLRVCVPMVQEGSSDLTGTGETGS